MSTRKRILSTLLVVLVAIQFIRPIKNNSTIEPKVDFTKQFNVPADIQNILKSSCYDCHSNNTNYPWYYNIQPMTWLFQTHGTQRATPVSPSGRGKGAERVERRRRRAVSSVARAAGRKVRPDGTRQHSRKDGNDRDHDQQFDQRESSPATHDGEPPEECGGRGMSAMVFLY